MLTQDAIFETRDNQFFRTRYSIRVPGQPLIDDLNDQQFNAIVKVLQAAKVDFKAHTYELLGRMMVSGPNEIVFGPFGIKIIIKEPR